jgi:molybdopterin biosynthesis enzyme
VKLVRLAEARSAFLAEIRPVAMTRMATAKAGGLVLAEDLLAPANVPAEAIALERGYAVASRATVGASSYLPAPLPAVPQLVEPGEALPRGTDAVADIDDIAKAPGGAEIITGIAPGRHLRQAGGDIAAGQAIAAAGTRLNASAVAVLRAAGIPDVPVRLPAIVIVAPQGSCPSAGLVMALASHAGADANLAYVPEYRIADALRTAGGADQVLLAGWDGATFRAAMQALGEAGNIIARDLAVSPGAAMACGRLASQAVPAVLLPGRVEETLAAWLLLARPALDCLAGFTGSRPSAALPLARKIASAPGIVELAFVRREADRWKPFAAGDISWSALAKADAWLAVPAESEGFAAGEIVEAEFL